MFCIYCGTPNPDDAIYCSACGKRTAQSHEAPPPAEAAESAAVETAAPTEPDGGQPQEPVVATGSTEASEVEEEGDNGQP